MYQIYSRSFSSPRLVPSVFLNKKNANSRCIISLFMEVLADALPQHANMEQCCHIVFYFVTKIFQWEKSKKRMCDFCSVSLGQICECVCGGLVTR